MSEERKEKLFNKMYYDYLEREEAQEVIDYMLKLEKENKLLKDYGEKVGERRNQLYDKIDKAIEYTKGFINGKTSRIDEWKNVELVLETIVEILGDKDGTPNS